MRAVADGGGGGGGGGGGDSSEDYTNNSRNSSVASTPSDINTMYYFKLKSAAFAPSSLINKDMNTTSEISEIPPFMSLLCNDFSNLSPNDNNLKHEFVFK